MICSYCEKENLVSADLCYFCQAPLNKKRPRLKELVFIEQAELSYQHLIEFHTYDILVLLRLVREERSKSYNLMRTLQKAPEGLVVDNDTLSYAESEYQRYTARMKVLEGILIDRMGYKPKRVDNHLLEKLRVKIEKP
ncbi:hypothetical protein [Priestia koreensis]|uniref:Uncharacterized protein n=1 Tax=Priestia koreensis TaxID=284581 RepID=A0A0M0KY52_9BACI|nr:hypothetical protein [Priestia koreensis]KOO43755.1 hypothetical protein AMD01_15475 [Priestia koreensis]